MMQILAGEKKNPSITATTDGKFPELAKKLTRSMNAGYVIPMIIDSILTFENQAFSKNEYGSVDHETNSMSKMINK